MRSDTQRRATIDAFLVRKTDPGHSSIAADKDRVRTGAVGAIGESLKLMTEEARTASLLQGQIEAGAVVVDLDPAALDSSLVKDRLRAEIDPSFETLVESMKTSGQQVPILVRPHPTQPDRHQIAYGHRRARAAARLGFRVRAIVRALTDAELVVAQGKENLDRRDLSYIEKALFARRLEDQGFERAVIMSALSTDKADLSRYIALAQSLPTEIIEAIGPAHKVGRPRWQALSERLKSAVSRKVAKGLVESDAFRALDSDGRFNLLFEAVNSRIVGSVTVPKHVDHKGGRVDYRADRTIVTIDEKANPQFGAFLAARLDELYAEFLKDKAQEARA